MEQFSTVIIWTLRIVLPIVLFIIYFRLQASQEETYPGPTKHQYARARLLSQRKVAVGEGGPAPEPVKDITLIGPDKAPHLFTPAASRSGRGGATSRSSRSAAGRSGEERTEKKERKRDQVEATDSAPATRTEADGADETKGAEEVPPKPTEVKAPEAEVAPKPKAKVIDPVVEEKQTLESLLNYVAFNRREQVRTFIVSDSAAPPPPPPMPRPKEPAPKPAAKPAGPLADDEAARDPPSKPAVTKEDSSANLEAQMVLNGAKQFKRSDMAMHLYDRLSSSGVEIAAATFKLMIEACVLAEDLKGASDFLVKMEARGHCPDTTLLDQVMDLYTSQKAAKREKKAAVEPKVDISLGGLVPVLSGLSPSDEHGHPILDNTTDADVPKVKLSTEARLFMPLAQGVPIHIPPPPPPPPPSGKPPADGAAKESEEADCLAERTALKTTSKLFVPQGYMAIWTAEDLPAKKKDGKGDKQQGKRDTQGKEPTGNAKAKAKEKAKSKAKATGGEHYDGYYDDYDGYYENYDNYYKGYDGYYEGYDSYHGDSYAEGKGKGKGKGKPESKGASWKPAARSGKWVAKKPGDDSTPNAEGTPEEL